MLAINSRGIVAHALKEGAYNGNLFMDFINNNLTAHFHSNPRDILVMDNCAFYHRCDVISLLNDLQIAHAFLPPYSPSLNPIEEYFSHLKSRYSSISPRPRNREDIMRRVTDILNLENIYFEGWFRLMRIWVDRGIARHEFT